MMSRFRQPDLGRECSTCDVFDTRGQAGTWWPLFENHLAFLATHRGAIRSYDDAVDVVGDADFLSCWIPLEAGAAIPATARTVWAVPWSGDGWSERLHQAGFQAAGALAYLEAPLSTDTTDAPPTDPSTDIVEVTSHQEALDFAAVQSAGFLEEPSPHDTWWRKTFTDVAAKNYGDSDQLFYLLRVDGVPAAVTVVVRSGDVFGVYAVTTRPEYRGRGYATALLARARHDVVSRGGRRLALQVEVGSAAERLYTKLGFTPRFHVQHHRR